MPQGHLVSRVGVLRTPAIQAWGWDYVNLMVPVGLGIPVDDVVGYLLFLRFGRTDALPLATRLLGRR